jgi:hypothetical protein
MAGGRKEIEITKNEILKTKWRLEPTQKNRADLKSLKSRKIN